MNRTLFLALALLVALASAGCEESVDAVLDSDQPFTLYGFFDPRADTQAVRVFPIEPVLRPVEDERLDASIRSTDLTTGEEVQWSDTLVSFGDGSRGHVAFAPFRAQYGHTYRLVITGTDGRSSRVEIPVPSLVDVERLEPFTRRFPNRVDPAPYLPVAWWGDARLIQIDVVYEFEVLNVGRNELAISYDGQQSQTEQGWVVEVDLARDQEAIRTEMLRTGFMSDTNALIELNSMFITAMVINADWDPPGGRFDPALLVEPGAWTNVENGFGFVGGGYVDELFLFPTGCYQQLAGFYIPEGNAC